jgi:hypothetical protein
MTELRVLREPAGFPASVAHAADRLSAVVVVSNRAGLAGRPVHDRTLER